MTRRPWWLAGVLLLVGCGSEPTATAPTLGSTSSSVSLNASSTSAGSSPVTTVAVTSYTVRGGDALYLIAQEHCVTADDIVTVNDWSDGLDHPLFPGDSILLPADSCSNGSSTLPSMDGDTGEPVSKEDTLLQLADPVEQLREIRFAFDGLSGTNAGQFSDPDCVNAYAVGLDFELGIGSKAEVRAALTALGEPVPTYLTDYIEAWDKFLDAHGDDALRILATNESQGEQAALADPALAEAAYALVNDMYDHGRRRVSEFVNGDRCRPFQL